MVQTLYFRCRDAGVRFLVEELKIPHAAWHGQTKTPPHSEVRSQPTSTGLAKEASGNQVLLP